MKKVSSLFLLGSILSITGMKTDYHGAGESPSIIYSPESLIVLSARALIQRLIENPDSVARGTKEQILTHIPRESMAESALKQEAGVVRELLKLSLEYSLPHLSVPKKRFILKSFVGPRKIQIEDVIENNISVVKTIQSLPSRITVLSEHRDQVSEKNDKYKIYTQGMACFYDHAGRPLGEVSEKEGDYPYHEMSPDGKHVLVTRFNKASYVITFDSKKKIDMASGFYSNPLTFLWSGCSLKVIAYGSSDSLNPLLILDRATGDVLIESSTVYPINHIDSNPDGKSICIVQDALRDDSGFKLVIYDITGSLLRHVWDSEMLSDKARRESVSFENKKKVQWSFDGLLLACFVENNTAVLLFDLKSPRPFRIITRNSLDLRFKSSECIPPDIRFFYPYSTFSKPGNLLLVTSFQRKGGFEWYHMGMDYELYRMTRALNLEAILALLTHDRSSLVYKAIDKRIGDLWEKSKRNNNAHYQRYSTVWRAIKRLLNKLSCCKKNRT